MLKFLNPGLLSKLIDKYNYLFLLAMCLFMVLGIYFAIFDSPADYQQGEVVRIMYVHVPAAWMSLIIYAIVAFSSAAYLIWLSPVNNEIAKCSAPIGMLFSIITLVTGSLWGKPTWGTWWVWDARLTSMFILFLFYVGYVLLCMALEDNPSSKATAILAILGFINVPIVKFSVDMWNSLHQPASIIRLGGPTIHSSMLLPLFLMIAGSFFYYLFAISIKIRSRFIEHKIEKIESKLF